MTSLTTAGWIVAAGIVAAWIAVAVLMATYADARKHPWQPIFISSLFIPFPIVLLLLAIVPKGDDNG